MSDVPQWLKDRGYPRTEKRGNRTVRTYGTWTVPDDEYPDWKGYARRAHLSILCGNCKQASPYIMGIEPVSETPKEDDTILVVEDTTYECPRCGMVWQNRHSYFEDDI